MSVATTDGERVWAFRYASKGRPGSLFHSTDVTTLRRQHPDNPMLRGLSDEARLIVSEPLGELAGAWNEVPPSSSTCARSSANSGVASPCRPVTPTRANQRQRTSWNELA